MRSNVLTRKNYRFRVSNYGLAGTNITRLNETCRRGGFPPREAPAYGGVLGSGLASSAANNAWSPLRRTVIFVRLSPDFTRKGDTCFLESGRTISGSGVGDKGGAL